MEKALEPLPTVIAPFILITTVHGLCLKLLYMYYKKCGFTKRPTVYGLKVCSDCVVDALAARL